MTEVKGAQAGRVAPAQNAIDFAPLMKALGQALAEIGQLVVEQMLPRLLEAAVSAPVTTAKHDGFDTGPASQQMASRQMDRVKPLDVEVLRQRKEVPFYSQFDAAHVPGAGEGASYKACRAMAHAVGVKMAAGPGDRIDVASEGLNAVRDHVHAELAQGRPVALAVARHDGKTGFMLAVDSPEKGAWIAHDPAHRDPAKGRSQLILFDAKSNAMVHHDGERRGHVSGAVRSQGPIHVEHHHDHAGLAGGPVAGIRRGAHARPIPVDKQQALARLLHQAGSGGALLTSTSRMPQDQARIMFENLRKYGPEQQHRLYAGPGDHVINVYERLSTSGASDDAIKAAMTQEILKQGPSRVSNHCAAEGSTVVDVSPSSVGSPEQQRAFVAAVEQAQREGRVKTFLHPGNSTDPAFHIEFA